MYVCMTWSSSTCMYYSLIWYDATEGSTTTLHNLNRNTHDLTSHVSPYTVQRLNRRPEFVFSDDTPMEKSLALCCYVRVMRAIL